MHHSVPLLKSQDYRLVHWYMVAKCMNTSIKSTLTLPRWVWLFLVVVQAILVFTVSSPLVMLTPVLLIGGLIFFMAVLVSLTR